MEPIAEQNRRFEPELFCLRCERMEWDEQARQCANFDQPVCPLAIKSLLADFEVQCLVV